MTHPPPTAPDGPPINVVVTPVNTRTIKVTWDPPAVENRNGIITRYSVSYFPVGDSNAIQQLSTEATFLVVTAGITPDMEYNFTVAAITILIGPESSGIVQRSYPLPPLPPQDPPRPADNVEVTLTTIPFLLPAFDTSLYR